MNIMFRIEDFTPAHIEQASRIALMNYEAERVLVPALPPIEAVPTPAYFAKNNLGVAAFEGGGMVGFLCCTNPFENAFRSTGAVGVFSPMGASGAVGGNRAQIFARMYQAAAEKWVRAGASSHAICLYAHDGDVQRQMYAYSFGMRCIDAIRITEPVSCPEITDCSFEELPARDVLALIPLNKALVRHLEQSPAFMHYPHTTEDTYAEMLSEEGLRFFVARQDGRVIAYLKISGEGETFICDDMPNITGAFCLPEWRGQGIFQNLLNAAISVLRAEGHFHLGVDLESFNPTAHGFWPKYFNAYTHSVVRRIDEGALN